MQTVIQDYFNGLCCTEIPPVTYNFDITANWATGDSSYPVTDQASFEVFLSERGYDENNDLTSIVITDFNLQGNHLQCNLTAEGTVLDLSQMSITQFLSVGNINGLLSFLLKNNNIVTFNPNVPLPNSLTYLTIANNQIITFNPTLPLPVNLLYLSLNYNQIIVFNPTLPLPTSLQILGLSDNLMTTAGYTASEPWANGMHTAPSGGVIYLNGNPDSASGTNLETILTSKGWTVTV
jgi:Leucine-rich repeat (LRR) protein